MKRFRLSGKVRYPGDCDRIIRVAREHLGYELNRAEAAYIWECVSGERDAQWLGLPADFYVPHPEDGEDGLVHNLRKFFRQMEHELVDEMLEPS